MIQMTEEVKRGNVLQDLIFTNKDELVGNVNARSRWNSGSWEKTAI